jgi:hypothetical protein
MSMGIVFEAMTRVFLWGVRHRIASLGRRSPQRRSGDQSAVKSTPLS